MTNTLQFIRTPLDLTVLLGFKSHRVATGDAIFGEVLEMVKAGASEEALLAVFERTPVETTGTSTNSDNKPEEDAVGVDAPYGIRAIRGGYAGQTTKGAFDVEGDGQYVCSFESFDFALDYAKSVADRRFDEVVIKNGDVLMATVRDEGCGVHVRVDSVLSDTKGAEETVEEWDADDFYNFQFTLELFVDGICVDCFSEVQAAKLQAVALFSSGEYAHVLLCKEGSEIFSLRDASLKV